MFFCDIHTHIIPGIDDGSKSEEMTREMLKLSFNSGVRHIILTSHFNEYRNQTENVKEHLDKVRKIAKEVSDELNVYPGNEIFFSNNSKRLLLDGTIATLADSKYVLIEFQYETPLKEIASAVNQIQSGGYWPVIAHIERYKCMHEKGAAEYIASTGAYLQMNAGYIANAKFKDKHFIKSLFKEKLISFVASDCHNVTSRCPNIDTCIAMLTKNFGSEAVQRVLYDNPMKIIKNERI